MESVIPFKILSLNFPGGTEENIKHFLNQGIQYPDRDSNEHLPNKSQKYNLLTYLLGLGNTDDIHERSPS
jgi:hypothetical protein